jgi:hypothetical protein
MKPRCERLQVVLTQEQLSALDDFRFANRLPSRAAAFREIIFRGIAAADTEPAMPDFQTRPLPKSN